MHCAPVAQQISTAKTWPRSSKTWAKPYGLNCKVVSSWFFLICSSGHISRKNDARAGKTPWSDNAGRVSDLLMKNPSLKNYLDEVVTDAYRYARGAAGNDMGLAPPSGVVISPPSVRGR